MLWPLPLSVEHYMSVLESRNVFKYEDSALSLERRRQEIAVRQSTFQLAIEAGGENEVTSKSSIENRVESFDSFLRFPNEGKYDLGS